jgi:hypothetical protein
MAKASPAISRTFQEKLEVLISEDPRTWISFCQRVHAHAAEAPVFAEGVLQPYVVPQTDFMPFSLSVQDTTHAQIPRLARDLGTNL